MGEVMTRIGWTLADLATQLLEPHERDAVCGDLAECGASGWRTLREVLGLVARRQAALWADWRPWIAVIAIVVPIGMMLSHGTRWWADSNAVYISLYIKVWQWSDLGYPGWRHDLWLLIWYGTTSSMAIAAVTSCLYMGVPSFLIDPTAMRPLRPAAAQQTSSRLPAIG